MSRSSKWRLAKAVPLMCAVAGAVASIARKRRARPTAYDMADRAAVASPIAEPSMGPSAPAPAPAPVPSTPSVATATDFAYVEEVTEIVAPMAGTNSTQTVDVPGEPPAEADVTSVTGGAHGASTTATRALEALAQGGDMTAAEVAAVTGIARATVSSALSRLARGGKVAKAQRGYRLAGEKEPRASGTKAKVLAALSSDVGMTAGDVVAATGLARGTVSTTLSRLLKSGEVVKAERGYRLPG
jgi:DNA-binding transcriptional ArsR family regulator